MTEGSDEYLIPEGYFYTKEHEWVKKLGGEKARVGITDYAAKMLHDIVYVSLPDVGSSFNVNDVFGQVESVKTVSDIYMPVSGTVLDTNQNLTRTPESVSNSPYDEGWMLEVDAPRVNTELGNLLNALDYRKYIENLKESET